MTQRGEKLVEISHDALREFEFQIYLREFTDILAMKNKLYKDVHVVPSRSEGACMHTWTKRDKK